MVPRADALTQLRRGVLEHCVLAILERGERYGRDLVNELSEVEGMVTSEGTIYPLLSRLKSDGLVETTWQESPSGPPRKYHRLTKAGRSALAAFKVDWAGFTSSVDQILKERTRG